jgi:hypothetical protein
MDVKKTPAAVEEFLFGRGQSVDEYFIEETPDAELLRYQNADGQVVELPINDAEFAAALSARLKELGVRVAQAQPAN